MLRTTSCLMALMASWTVALLCTNARHWMVPTMDMVAPQSVGPSTLLWPALLLQSIGKKRSTKKMLCGSLALERLLSAPESRASWGGRDSPLSRATASWRALKKGCSPNWIWRMSPCWQRSSLKGTQRFRLRLVSSRCQRVDPPPVDCFQSAGLAVLLVSEILNVLHVTFLVTEQICRRILSVTSGLKDVLWSFPSDLYIAKRTCLSWMCAAASASGGPTAKRPRTSIPPGSIRVTCLACWQIQPSSTSPGAALLFTSPSSCDSSSSFFGVLATCTTMSRCCVLWPMMTPTVTSVAFLWTSSSTSFCTWSS
uniref:Putative secreted protein n=1 Tax=Ixodes ricinus TaxID=34613 RepID=A0A6B0VA49_IXORI